MDIIEEVTAIIYTHMPDAEVVDVDLVALSIKKWMTTLAAEDKKAKGSSTLNMQGSKAYNNDNIGATKQGLGNTPNLLSNATLIWDKPKDQFQIYSHVDMLLGVLNMSTVHSSLDTIVKILPDGTKLEGIDLGGLLDGAVVGMINTGKEQFAGMSSKAGMGTGKVEE